MDALMGAAPRREMSSRGALGIGGERALMALGRGYELRHWGWGDDFGGTLLSQIHWGASRIIAAAGGFGRGAEAVAWDVDHCLPALGPGESSGLICRSPVPSQRPAVPRGYAWRLESHGPDLSPSCRLLAL